MKANAAFWMGYCRVIRQSAINNPTPTERRSSFVTSSRLRCPNAWEVMPLVPIRILHHEEGIDVIPSNKLLSGMDMSLFTVENREKVLKEYLELLENDYDYILIDCMPSLGMMTINALSAADSVLIPVQPQYYAADGLMELLKVVKGIHQRFNPDLQIEGILFTMDSSHYNNSKRNKQAVRDAYGAEIIIFDQTIPRTEALAETASEGVSIFSYDAKGKGAYSYQALVQEVLNHA